jgi:hypothetical protein
MKMVLRQMILATAAALLVAACGGGGGGGESTAPPAVAVPPPVASVPPPAAEKTVFVTGAIAGFGSVIVNGVRYDTTGTEVRIGDRAGAMSELRVGHVVRVEGKVDDRGQARAVRIEQHALVRGPVQAIDVVAGAVMVAGQKVRIDDDTSFDDSIRGASVGGIVLGERVEVHGFSTSGGEARATRIEKPDATELEIEVSGIVQGLDPVARRFRVGTLAVDYSVATVEGFGAAGLRDGDRVEVKGQALLADGALRATRVHQEDDGVRGTAGGEAEVEGLVTRFQSSSDFSVAGQRVIATTATAYVGGAAVDIKLDAKLEVEGRLDASGVLVASKVTFKRSATIELTGPVEAVNASEGTLRALGVVIKVDASTRTEDKEGDQRSLALSDLRVGDWVEVRAFPDPAADGRLVATRLERVEPDDEVELRGRADALQAPRFRISAVNVETTPATRFEQQDVQIDAAKFFARASGQIVEVEGSWNGLLLVARKAEIEHGDGASLPPPTTPPPVVQPPPTTPPPVVQPPPTTPPPVVQPPPLDGAALYSSNCAACHGPITAIRSMTASNRSAADFRRAINGNKGGMGFLATLSDAQLQAIADAIRAANP